MKVRYDILLAVLIAGAGCATNLFGPGEEDAGSDAGPDAARDGATGPTADGSMPGDGTNTPNNVSSATCGDGVVAPGLDGDWFAEECDLGAANGSGDVACGSDCTYRRCDSGRACGPFRSTFAAYMPTGEDAIRDYYLRMRRDGYEEVIFVNIGGQEWVNSGGWAPAGEQDGFYDDSDGSSHLQDHLRIAEQAGVDVVVGLGGIIPTGGYEWQVWLSDSVRDPFIAWNLDLAQEVIDQVGDSPAFKGFYLSQEMNLGDAAQCTSAGDYYAEMIAGAQGRPGLRTLAATREITVAPYLAVNGTPATTVGNTLRCLWDKLDASGGVDRVMVQDGVPKEAEGFTSLANVGDYFEAMHGALPAADRESLWVDLETYDWPDGECFLSRPGDINRIAGQVREVGRWVGGFTQWIHAHNFTAAGLGQDDCDDEREALGRAYSKLPFPFAAFIFQSKVFVRGYYLREGGKGWIRCSTAAGEQDFELAAADGLEVFYAPDWVEDDVVPDPDEIYEVSFPLPSECTGAYRAAYIGPDGTASAIVPFF